PVRDGVAAQRDLLGPLDVALALLDRLLDGRRHLVGLAVAVGHPTPPVADDDQGVEAEPPAALDPAGTPPDFPHEIDQRGVPRVGLALVPSITRHVLCLCESPGTAVP